MAAVHTATNRLTYTHFSFNSMCRNRMWNGHRRLQSYQCHRTHLVEHKRWWWGSGRFTLERELDTLHCISSTRSLCNHWRNCTATNQDAAE